MAQKTEIHLVDDLDGSEAQSTIGFAWQGKGYEIDLSVENATRFEEAVAEFISAARRTNSPAGFGGELRRGRSLPRSSRRSGGDTAIRAWGKANGFAVSERGRVSSLLRQAYREAQANGQVPNNEVPAE